MNQQHKNNDQFGPARTAILFDAENISWQLAEQAIELSTPFGKPILRAYADFSKGHTKGWEKPALIHGIRTIHQFSYDSKNSSSDFLMMHDAFKLVHSGKIDTFVIVTNDSDFITPIQLLRQSGAYVHGIGIKGKCASLLKESCNTFDLMTEKSEAQVSPVTTTVKTTSPQPRPKAKQKATPQPKTPAISKKIITQLNQAYELTEKTKKGWVEVSILSQKAAIQKSPYKKFSSLLKHSGCFELMDNNKRAKLIKS
ncbi:NYN domain-containing protein [Endozoicomonas ascidiicola]|uniref:NYN domain-containing protein n=1 Tax=Endozoicomonas ascidiicola TaxID=1698521 RepID=UPI00082A3AFF|nr:NYN domain-containing protein [Endozoicomonas ascidiicola]